MEIDSDKIKELYKNKIATGADVKQIQYASYATDLCYKEIDLVKIIEKRFFNFNKPITQNCIFINIETDGTRYKSIFSELKKLSFDRLVHLKATFWKEKSKFVDDMNTVVNFLKKFQSSNTSSPIELSINEFSEFNDPNIYIQDGPLACYCSHVRAMIYGYLNFKDYFIIVEDDSFIANTRKIEKYINEIPDDWDVILFNSVPLHKTYDTPWYKLESIFHSTHFYIIREKAIKTIFENIYPIVDQIDILIARLYDRLNIYNIVDTVYQKNFSTNTQNNLFVIYNTPCYVVLKNYIKETIVALRNYINTKLPYNNNNINKLASKIYDSVIYDYIINNFDYEKNNVVGDQLELSEKDDNLENPSVNFKKLDNHDPNYLKMYEKLYIVINCAVKGKQIHNRVMFLLQNIEHIISSFDKHDPSRNIYAYDFGATSNVYLIKSENKPDNILKVYNDTFRWNTTKYNHNDKNQETIFNKEIEILKKLYPNFVKCDLENKSITTPYFGQSLYENFSLPSNWRDQIRDLFDYLTSQNIYYPEFNIKNIVVSNEVMNFIDFGLSLLESNNVDNESNCKVFIEILEKLETKMKQIDDECSQQKDTTEVVDLYEKKHILYNTFIFNIKNEGKYINNIF
jgi:hypothetical protein